MYRAKAQGSGRYQLFDRDMRQQAVDQLRVETDLRRALKQSEFILYYPSRASTIARQTRGVAR